MRHATSRFITIALILLAVTALSGVTAPDALAQSRVGGSLDKVVVVSQPIIADGQAFFRARGIGAEKDVSYGYVMDLITNSTDKNNTASLSPTHLQQPSEILKLEWSRVNEKALYIRSRPFPATPGQHLVVQISKIRLSDYHQFGN